LALLGNLHAFAAAGAYEVGFEFGDHGQDVDQQPADGSVGSWTAPPMLSFRFRLVRPSMMWAVMETTGADTLPERDSFAGGVYGNLGDQDLYGIYRAKGTGRRCRGGGPANGRPRIDDALPSGSSASPETQPFKPSVAGGAGSTRTFSRQGSLESRVPGTEHPYVL
jgi:hypothetical protein